ncbi:hypothetical protein K0504_09895 [Neiella marina]|uniref:Uncharacterized protein n=1 Tax=Neiella holothuriorum TaxID=2870530 RepID=A0ABS7EG83_9GAMM|nr:hypothetical protein [Neiella holothuriorum]MBW8191349.1 hypothetical protein [Neiella holothuriorum]
MQPNTDMPLEASQIVRPTRPLLFGGRPNPTYVAELSKPWHRRMEGMELPVPTPDLAKELKLEGYADLSVPTVAFSYENNAVISSFSYWEKLLPWATKHSFLDEALLEAFVAAPMGTDDQVECAQLLCNGIIANIGTSISEHKSALWQSAQVGQLPQNQHFNEWYESNFIPTLSLSQEGHYGCHNGQLMLRVEGESFVNAAHLEISQLPLPLAKLIWKFAKTLTYANRSSLLAEGAQAYAECWELTEFLDSLSHDDKLLALTFDEEELTDFLRKKYPTALSEIQEVRGDDWFHEAYEILEIFAMSEQSFITPDHEFTVTFATVKASVEALRGELVGWGQASNPLAGHLVSMEVEKIMSFFLAHYVEIDSNEYFSGEAADRWIGDNRYICFGADGEDRALEWLGAGAMEVCESAADQVTLNDEEPLLALMNWQVADVAMQALTSSTSNFSNCAN